MKILADSGYRPERQLQHEIVNRCRAGVSALAAYRNASDPAQWRLKSQELTAFIKAAFPAAMWERDRNRSARLVSRHEFDSFCAENVIFESFAGWEVNGTVYLPKKPGRYPGVVCPTGHSAKTGESYQTAAQVFARNGYIAISFDPPGCAGEIAYGNDHLTHGWTGYLTGYWSNCHFVMDALCCMDYLETRDDVDREAGFAMTGVSGGGYTSIFGALLDERVRFYAPVCCIGEHETIHFTDLYTSCPEQFAPGFMEQGLDFVDLLAIQAPKPCLIVGGKLDEVFDYRATERIYRSTAHIYRLYECEDRLGYYMQSDSGHAYTAEMAAEVVRWMNRVMKATEDEPLPISRTDLCMLPADKLQCHPSNAVNMHTINRAEAYRLRKLRLGRQSEAGHGGGMRSEIRRTLGLTDSELCRPEEIRPVQEEAHPPVWSAQFRSLVLSSAESAYVPGLLCKRIAASLQTVKEQPQPAMLFIDESGKWEGFRQGGFLTRAAGIMSRSGQTGEPLILSVDVSGFGELRPQPAFYDVASWNDIERILTYLSVASGKPVMGYRVRDALHAWHYLRMRPDVDRDQLILAGRGAGAIVALFAALFAGSFSKLILWDGLVHYQALTEAFSHSWPQSVVVPHILRYGDMPELVREVDCRQKIVINPRDAQRGIVPAETAEKWYGNEAILITESSESQAIDRFVASVYVQ